MKVPAGDHGSHDSQTPANSVASLDDFPEPQAEAKQ